MEDLGATGSPHLIRSMTERVNISPTNKNQERLTGIELNQSLRNRQSLKEELDQKKVMLLELETENGEMKTLIEQMSKEV